MSDIYFAFYLAEKFSPDHPIEFEDDRASKEAGILLTILNILSSN